MREGQRTMAAAVADAIATGRNLVVEAGTGTGKSLAYLVPAVRSGKRTVVATATKALQDQLAGKDLPFLATHPDAPVEFAVLKGRSNYACRQRLRELAAGDDGQLSLDGTVDRAPAAELAMLVEWAASSETGDRAELDVEPTAAGVGRGERFGAGVPRRHPLPVGRRLLRRGRPREGRRGGRRRRQPAPLRPPRRERRRCCCPSTTS